MNDPQKTAMFDEVTKVIEAHLKPHGLKLFKPDEIALPIVERQDARCAVIYFARPENPDGGKRLGFASAEESANRPEPQPDAVPDGLGACPEVRVESAEARLERKKANLRGLRLG